MGDVTRPPSLELSFLHPGMRVAVALSGGADSVGLLRAMMESAPEAGPVMSVVHVHHGLRGGDADQDAQFVADLAERFRLPFLSYQADTAQAARDQGQTLEEAGRHIRYTWFRELLAQNKAEAVATGHTLDDQADT